MSKVIVFLDGPDAGRLLASYDPDYENGRGLVGSTDDPAEAMLFPDMVSAWNEWKRPSTVHPIRLTDGKPNRPMSAFTITVCDVTEAEEQMAFARKLAR
jgi:hypothetical protein